jgi:hypothetical protein
LIFPQGTVRLPAFNIGSLAAIAGDELWVGLATGEEERGGWGVDEGGVDAGTGDSEFPVHADRVMSDQRVIDNTVMTMNSVFLIKLPFLFLICTAG